MDSTELIKCIERLYSATLSSKGPQCHSTKAESQVKQAAAIYLSRCPNFRAITPAIAKYVEKSVGSVTQLGLDKSFGQLLAEEPCFVLEDAKNGHIVLDVQQIVQRGSAGVNLLATDDSIVSPGSSSLYFTSSDEDDDQAFPCTHPALRSPSPATAGSAASPSPSIQQLLLYIISHRWHSSNQQLNLVRRALAVHLVQSANAAALAASAAGGAAGSLASGDPSKYRITSPKAGQVMLKAWKEQFEGQARCYSSIKEAVLGDRYLSTFMSGPSEQSVQLDIQQLLKDVAAAHCHDAARQQHVLGNPGSSSSSSQASRDREGTSLSQTAGTTRGTSDAAAAAAKALERLASPRPESVAKVSAVREAAAAAAGQASGRNTSPNALAAQASINSVPPLPTQPTSSSNCLTAGQLLHCVSTRVWHATNPQLHAVRRAIAMRMVQESNAVQLQATGLQTFEITATNAGPIMLQVLQQQFPGQRQFWQNTSHAFADDLYFSTYKSGVSERTVRLDVGKLLRDVGASDQAAPPLSPPAEAAAQPPQQQAMLPPTLHTTTAFTAAAPQAAGRFSFVADQTPPPPPPRPVGPQVVSPPVQPPPPPPPPPPPAAATTTMSYDPLGHQIPPLAASPRLAKQQAGAATAVGQPPPPPPREPTGTTPGAPAAVLSAGQCRPYVHWLDNDEVPAAGTAPAATGPSLASLPAGSSGATVAADHHSDSSAEGLQLLSRVSHDVCATAKVVHVATSPQQPQDQQQQQQEQQQRQVCSMDRLLQHLAAAKLAAWEFVFSGSTAECSAAAPATNLGSSSHQSAITRVSVFVPPTGTWAAALYKLDLDASVAASSQSTSRVMQHLKPLVESRSMVNVVHDVRQVSVVLQQQFGITLKRPLDTQLLTGIIGLSFAAVSSSNSSSETSSSVDTSDLTGNSLQQALRMHGFTVNTHTEHVRYLLLLAQKLLQQLPTTVLDIGDLQVLLAQRQRPGIVSSMLQLEPHLLPGYSPVIAQPVVSGSSGSSSHSGPAGTIAAARPAQFYLSGETLQSRCLQGLASSQADQPDLLTDQALLQLCFELKIHHQQAGGWFRSRYDIYLNDKQHADGVPPSAAARSPQVEAGCPAASEDSVSAVAEDLQVDEAVQSMMSLLPHRLHTYLQPYTSTQHQPALMEIIIDSDDDVKIRLSDKTTIALDIRIDIPEALADLAAAKQGGIQSLAADLQSSQQSNSIVVGPRACQSVSSLVPGKGGISISMCQTSVSDAAPADAAIETPKGRKCLFGLFGSRRHTASSDKVEGPDTCARSVAAAAQAASASADAAGFDGASSTGSSAATAKLAAACAIGSDNRIGVAGTLHRISAMRDKQGRGVTGLTYRIGRDVRGVAGPLADIFSSCKASLEPFSRVGRRCVLLLGRPGVGKTTLLRSVAYLMSVPAANGGLGLSVDIVDTSNEIAGDSEVRHPCIGTARRMMVRKREDQADVLIEAVQNHTPDVIIVDEIGTRKEVEAAKTIAQRGVQLVATAHGDTLGDLLRNPTLKDLVGGTTSVTLGDAAAKISNGGRKTVTERLGSATFNTLVELRSKQEWCLHLDVERSIDAMLRTGLSDDGGRSEEEGCHQQSASSREAITQVRTVDGNGHVLVKFESPAAAKQALSAAAVVDKLAERASCVYSQQGST